MCKGMLSGVCADLALSKTAPVLSVFLAATFFGSGGYATDWGAPENSRQLTEDGKFEFRIAPNQNWNVQFGACRGTLYAKNDNSLKLCWERLLINNVCPIRAFVSNSGEFVVTVGEWGDYEHLPIVIYGVGGRLINVYGELQQLVPLFSSQRVSGRALPHSWNGRVLPRTWSGRDWLSHSLLFFEPKERYFIVRLSNGEVLVFETMSGRLIDDQWKEANRIFPDKMREYGELKESLVRLIVMRALALASSHVPEDKKDGLFVLAQIKDRESISALADAVKDPTSRIVNTPQGSIREYPIRKVAKKALETLGEKVPRDVVLEESVRGNGKR
jgi:hypothetical protein